MHPGSIRGVKQTICRHQLAGAQRVSYPAIVHPADDDALAGYRWRPVRPPDSVKLLCYVDGEQAFHVGVEDLREAQSEFGGGYLAAGLDGSQRLAGDAGTLGELQLRQVGCGSPAPYVAAPALIACVRFPHADVTNTLYYVVSTLHEESPPVAGHRRR